MLVHLPCGRLQPAVGQRGQAPVPSAAGVAAPAYRASRRLVASPGDQRVPIPKQEAVRQGRPRALVSARQVAWPRRVGSVPSRIRALAVPCAAETAKRVAALRPGEPMAAWLRVAAEGLQVVLPQAALARPEAKPADAAADLQPEVSERLPAALAHAPRAVPEVVAVAQPDGRPVAERMAAAERDVRLVGAEPEERLPVASAPPWVLAWGRVLLCRLRRGLRGMARPVRATAEPESELATMLLQTCPPRVQWWRARRGVTLS